MSKISKFKQNKTMKKRWQVFETKCDPLVKKINKICHFFINFFSSSRNCSQTLSCCCLTRDTCSLKLNNCKCNKVIIFLEIPITKHKQNTLCFKNYTKQKKKSKKETIMVTTKTMICCKIFSSSSLFIPLEPNDTKSHDM